MTNALPARGALALMLLACSLAACGGGDDDGRTASGEVLEGTISDEMLPLDTRTSQPPLLRTEQAASGSGDAADEDDAAADGEGESDAGAETPGAVQTAGVPPPPAAPAVVPPAD